VLHGEITVDAARLPLKSPPGPATSIADWPKFEALLFSTTEIVEWVGSLPENKGTRCRD
jgi:hypothetical protein